MECATTEPCVAPTPHTPPIHREEQYRQLWEELEDFLHAHHGNSERHAKVRSSCLQCVCYVLVCAASSVCATSWCVLPPVCVLRLGVCCLQCVCYVLVCAAS